MRIRLNGKATNVGLGAYPVVMLARARQKALANARIVSEGRDPRDRNGHAPTFEQAVETVIKIHAENWKDGASPPRSGAPACGTTSCPKIGAKRVDRISTAAVMEVLFSIWSTKRETARRVRQRISAVIEWAVTQGYREDNPAGDASTRRRSRTRGSAKLWHGCAYPVPTGHGARLRVPRAHSLPPG